MNTNVIAMSARRGIIWIGKYAPFVIVAIVTLSNTEALYSLLTGQYAEYNGEIVYYKPISWFIGDIFELSVAWIFALFVLSIGVEACVWNRACIVFLSLVLLQKDFFLEHTINETYFAIVLIINSTIGILLVVKGLRIISRK
jgi:hypothetical protein